MPVLSPPLYLLDTNILIHAVRDQSTWQRIKAACDPLMVEPRPVYSVITEGEVLSFGLQRGWSEAKRQQAQFYLGTLRE